MEKLEKKVSNKLKWYDKLARTGKAMVLAGTITGFISGLYAVRPDYHNIKLSLPTIHSQKNIKPTKKVHLEDYAAGIGALSGYEAIVLDPGHVGEANRGVKEDQTFWGNLIGKHYTDESDLTWNITNSLYNIIKKNSPAVRVGMTIYENEKNKYTNKCTDKQIKDLKIKRAENILSKCHPGNGLFLSIHIDEGKEGTLALYSKSNSRSFWILPDDKYISVLNNVAEPVLEELAKLNGFKNKHLQEDNLYREGDEVYILKELPKNYPALLFEVGCMNNKEDLAYLKQNPDKIAEAIYKGLLRK